MSKFIETSSEGVSLATLQDGSFDADLSSLTVGDLLPGFPVFTNGDKSLTSRLIQPADISGGILTNPLTGTLQVTGSVVLNGDNLGTHLATIDSSLGIQGGGILSLETSKLNRDGSLAMSGALNMSTQKITNLATPTATADAANKGYVDTTVSSLATTVSAQGTAISDNATSVATLTTDKISRDGSIAMTGSLNLGTNSVTGVTSLQTSGGATISLSVAPDVNQVLRSTSTTAASWLDIVTIQQESNVPTLTPDLLKDQVQVISQNQNLTVATPPDTAKNGQKIIFRIKSTSATARTITWASTYRPLGTTLPVSLPAGKYIYVGCIYNSADSVFDVVAVSIQS